MRSMRVCFVFASFYPKYGGAAIYVQRFIPHLREQGVDSFVCTAAIPGRPSRENIGQIEIVRVPVTGKGRLRQLSYQISLAAFLVKHRADYDIIHFGDGSGSAYLIIPILKMLGKPIVVESTLMGSDDGIAVMKQKLGKLKLIILKRVDFIWGLSTAIGQSYLAVGFSPNRVHIIPYGIDTTVYRPASSEEKLLLRRNLGFALDAKVAVFVGGMNKRKGIDSLIRSFIQIHQENPQSQLLLVGPRDKESYGDYAATLDRMIQELGIASAVTFTGEVTNVADYLRCADVYVMASYSEGLGLGMLEAMACGLPCVVMELSGITDMVFDTDSGIVVHNRDETEFARQVIQLFQNPNLAQSLGQSNWRRIQQSFDIRQRALKFRELYGSLMKSNG